MILQETNNFIRIFNRNLKQNQNFDLRFPVFEDQLHINAAKIL